MTNIYEEVLRLMENNRISGLQEWIDYCEDIIKENPYPARMDENGNNDFDKHLELAVKSKIYHTAIYEYRLKLKEMLREEMKAEAEL